MLVADDIIVDANTILDLVSYGITNGSGDLITVNGTLQLHGDQTFTIDSNPALASGSTVEYTDTTGSIAIQNWDYTSGSLKINGSGATYTMGAGETIGENLTISAGTFDVSDQTLSVNGNTTIDGGTMMTGTGVVTFGNAGADSVTLSSGGLEIESDDIANDIVVTADTWTNSGGTITVKSNTATLPAKITTFNHLTIDSTGTTQTMPGNYDINGNFTITNGTFATGNNNITLAGNWSNSGTFTPGTGTVTFDGAVAQTVTGDTF